MDLDKMKKVWKETEVSPNISESEIQKMLDNKSRGAFENLLRLERIVLLFLVPCILFGLFFLDKHLISEIIYFAFLIPSIFWQLFKISFLKKIDCSTMGVLQISKAINSYKQFLLYELLIGTIWVFLFFISYTYWAIPYLFPNLSFEGTATLSIVLLVEVVTVIIIVGLVYKYLYWKNINKIKEAIKEIEYFETENI